MIYVRELTPDDAAAVAAVEAELHVQKELRDGVDGHRQYLTEAAEQGVNLSFGLFDDARLVGYFLCYGFEPAIFPGGKGDVIYIEDIAIRPPYRRHLYRLFQRAATEAVRHFPTSIVEAHALEPLLKVWRKHAEFFAKLGWEQMSIAAIDEVVGGYQRYAIRMMPSAERISDVENLQQLLARLPAVPVVIEGTEFSVTTVKVEADWPSLQTVWDTLLLETPGHTVFQSYAYQRLWWRHFGGDNELQLVVICRGKKLVGIAPLQLQRYVYARQYFNELCFIGSRWEGDRPVFLFGRDDGTLLRVLVSYLTQAHVPWDLCQLYEQIDNERTLQQLTSEFRAAGCFVGHSRDSDCPHIQLQGGWQAFLAAKPQKFRKNLKAAGRKLEEQGKLVYTVYDTLPEVAEQLEVYKTIEARSWKSAEGVGVSRNEEYFAFYQEMVRELGRTQSFVIRMLTLDGKPIAGTFGLVHDGTYYSLQIAHDRDYDKCSPGTYLEAREIEQCFDAGLREYEFLGGFLNNKSRWTTTFRHTTQLHVYRRKPTLVLLYVAFFKVKPLLKRLLQPYLKRKAESE